MNTVSYASLGYGVFPLQPGGKAPATKNGLKDATTDSTVIKSWPSRLNVAVLPPENVLVLDADTPEEVARLGRDYPELRNAPRCDTPSGGSHFYLRLPEGATPPKTRVKVNGRDFDIRGLGKAYLVAPPSVLPTGRYEWVHSLVAPDELPEASSVLLELLSPTCRKPSLPPKRHILPVGKGSRNYAQAALQNEYDNLAGAPEGTRNDILNRAAFSLGTLVGADELDRAEVEDVLRGAAATCGLEPNETEATLKSGLEAGMTQPRAVPTGSHPTSRSSRVYARMRGWARG